MVILKQLTQPLGLLAHLVVEMSGLYSASRKSVDMLDQRQQVPVVQLPGMKEDP
jgi:hypothetical protein